jgi:hypothetical protein
MQVCLHEIAKRFDVETPTAEAEKDPVVLDVELDEAPLEEAALGIQPAADDEVTNSGDHVETSPQTGLQPEEDGLAEVAEAEGGTGGGIFVNRPYKEQVRKLFDRYDLGILLLEHCGLSHSDALPSLR